MDVTGITEMYCLTVLEARDQDVSKTMLPLKVLGKDLFQTFLLDFDRSLACGRRTPISWGVFPVYRSLCLNIPLL